MAWKGAVVIVALLLGGGSVPEATQRVPQRLDPWSIGQQSAPDTLGWTADGLAAVEQFAASVGTAALIVVTDNRTVLARGRTDHLFRAHSVRKSFLSALIGMAVQSGQIDPNATLEELSIDDTLRLTHSEQAATVLQLLQARSGVYHPAASETAEMRAERPARGSFAPGEHWYYNNWDFNALGTLYVRATGEEIGEAFARRIAAPTGMQDFRPEHFRYQREDASQHAAYKFRISARDLARFGLLFLHEGAYDEHQLVPRSWVRRSTALRSLTGQSGTKSGYGLMWWVTANNDDGLPAGSFTASGSGGQRMTVLPGIDTVVVHLMDTDLDDGPSIGTSVYNELLRRLLAARR